MFKTELYILLVFSFALAGCQKDSTLSQKVSFAQQYAHHIEREMKAKEDSWESFKKIVSQEDKLIFLNKLSKDFRTFILEQISASSHQSNLSEAQGLNLRVAFDVTGEISLAERLSSYYLSNAQVEEAIGILERVYKVEPSLRIGLILSGVYSINENHQKVVKTYKQLERSFGLSFELCQGKIRYFQKEENLKSAIRFTKKCESRTKNAIEKSRYRYSLGRMYLGLGKLRTAKRFFQQAFDYDKAYENAVLALGVIHEEEGNWKKSLGVYEKFSEHNPYSETILTQSVDISLRNKQYPNAIKALERLVDLRTDNEEVKVKLGRVYLQSGNWKKAQYVFEELLDAKKYTSDSHYFLGHIYHRDKKFSRARLSFSLVEPKSYYYEDALIQLSRSLINQTKNLGFPVIEKRIRELMAESQKMKKEISFKIGTLLAHYLHENKEVDKAIQLVESLKNEHDFSREHQYFLASLYDEKKEYGKSDQLLKDLIQKNPKDANALNFLGYSYVTRGENLKLAYEYIKRAVKLKPKDGYILDSLGWYYYSRGSYNLAHRTLKKALKLQGGDDPVILSHYARSLDALSRTVQAYKQSKKAMRLANEPRELDEVQSYFRSISRRVPASVR